ncbi:MAG: RNA polymerase sigma factor, partial [Isosphaeraceae bacterium]
MANVHLGSVLRQIDRLLSGGTVVGLSDPALLRRFAVERDEEAFTGLLARHGPMVLAVCRGVLRNPDDAEDAFQATFLVLARQAHSLRVEGSLAGWLHRVAYRIAIRANVDATRRRSRELGE